MELLNNILENVDLKKLTTFRIGGTARYFYKPDTFEDLVAAKKFAAEKKLPYFVIGCGSNILASDEGYDGLIIKLGKGFSDFKFENDTLVAKAGAPLTLLARKSATLGLAGIHLLAGIPATLGGALYMNAGAYDQETGQHIVSIKVLEEDGSIKDYSFEECQFGYRKSVFQNTKKIILEATFKLTPANADELVEAQKKVMESRKTKQPLDLPNAGSMFKRPVGGYAGTLIDEAGLKGTSVGGAQVSTKHAGFIVNTGNATAKDVYDLTELVIQRVYENSGHKFKLEREVVMLGKIAP